MKFIKFFIFVSILLYPFSVDALFCEYTELSILKSQADNVNISYFPIYNDAEDLTFNIYISNLREDLILKDLVSNKIYNYSDNEIILEDYSFGKTYSFSIYTEKTSCTNKILRNISVKLPDYNRHYDLPICLENPDNRLCDKWIKTVDSEEEFIQLVNNSINKEKEDVPKETELKSLDDWYRFYSYLIYGTISLSLIMVILIYKERRKDFDLDV